ncbi:MAG: histidine--tRNA ligase [Candidatus Gastranaerophilales bacterium]|nr:histidine--tRNA ligase [Candidatus Gastranaerophilales bacterium]
MEYKAPKGTKDILPIETRIWQHIEEKAKNILETANYREIRTPIFEATELFKRGVGDSTDIVNKEMYTFEQKERSLTLRPENAAGVVRAFLEHGMHRLPMPVKLWYKGAMFRYERPQAGRQRQFHQLGVEMFGVENPSADAEVIALAMSLLSSLGVEGIALEINNIGCPQCRNEYKNRIKQVIQPKLEQFCPDCLVRFEKNPLRILDCKEERCKSLLASPEIDAVISGDFICAACVTHFEGVKDYLNALDVPYNLNKRLVRGLDYYNRTVFEITASHLGAQNAVCGGGRYDPLVATLGGPDTPAVGWAIGLERLVNLMKFQQEDLIDVFVVSPYTKEALNLAFQLRVKGISTDLDLSGRKFQKQLEKASKTARFALILGEDELKTGSLTLKNLSSGEQEKVSIEQIFQVIFPNQ